MNQIQEESARKESGYWGSWEKEKDQEECSVEKMMEIGKEKAQKIADKKENDQHKGEKLMRGMG